jgi:hypothetical protein
MSIVFCVLYPLGAISIHLPIDKIPGLRNTYLRNKVTAIHLPIQAIGTILLIGGFGLGIHLGKFNDYFNTKPVPYHMIIGILVVCIILVFQPALGMIQHRYYKKTGKKSVFAYAHRWIGRGAIILGIINDAFGLNLYGEAPKSSFVRNFTVAGVLCLIWFGLALVDMFRARGAKPAHAHKESEVVASHSPDGSLVKP